MSTRRPEEILGEISLTRHEMDGTLREIEQRLAPGQLMEKGMDYLKNNGGREYVGNLAGSLKTHPLPATLAGIGIAWLMAVGNKPAPSGNGAGSGSGMREKMHDMGDRLRGMGESMSTARGEAKDRASQLASDARQQMERARRGWNSITNEHPLALGAVGLAIGAVAAAMAPRTEKEAQLVDKVKRAATPSGDGEASKSEPAPQQAPGAASLPPDPALWPASSRALP